MNSSRIESSCGHNCDKCDLCSQIKQKIHSDLKEKINERIFEFKSLQQADNDKIFSEMCFCILTANFSAIRGIKIQNELGRDILDLSKEELACRLKELGYRFPNTRADYIFDSRKWHPKLKSILASYSFSEQRDLRNWLAKNVKGLGLKESSHFMRNIGYDDCAIIDFHIVDLLVEKGLIQKPKTLTKRKYQEIEKILKKIANINDINLAELDLILWFLETGKILK
jgi:N-glycosylase/DNA lyase